MFCYQAPALGAYPQKNLQKRNANHVSKHFLALIKIIKTQT